METATGSSLCPLVPQSRGMAHFCLSVCLSVCLSLLLAMRNSHLLCVHVYVWMFMCMQMHIISATKYE